MVRISKDKNLPEKRGYEGSQERRHRSLSTESASVTDEVSTLLRTALGPATSSLVYVQADQPLTTT